jgi:hypothetical protein
MSYANDESVKITIKVWTPLLLKLNAKLLAACLRRDAFIAMVLATELEHLDTEVSIPNSREAHRWISKQLAGIPRRITSLALPKSLVAELDRICASKRIVRDAFFNRLFLLLAAKPKTIDQLWFSGIADERWRNWVWTEFKIDGPFFERGFYPLEPATDPFWAIRTGLRIFNEDAVQIEEYLEPETNRTVLVQRDVTGTPEPLSNVYTVFFPQKVKDPVMGELPLAGLSCYVSDSLIPDSPAQRSQQAALDDLMAALA